MKVLHNRLCRHSVRRYQGIVVEVLTKANDLVVGGVWSLEDVVRKLIQKYGWLEARSVAQPYA